MAPLIVAASRGRNLWFAVGAAALVLAGGAGWWSNQRSAAPPSPSTPTVVEQLPSLPAPIETAQAQGASIEELLKGRSDDWRVARLALNPKILVIEFPTLSAQGQAMNRLAALVEKHKAPRDRVLSDEGLARLIRQSGGTAESFYFGHDYTAEAVARFFTMAVNQQLRLNPNELRLGNLLLFTKLLREESDRLVAASDGQAVVSFTAVQADDPRTPADEGVDAQRREAILRHELSHGEFFTNAAYRRHCLNFWQRLSDDDRNAFRAFLTQLDYDPRNEELMVNEAQAFLMHTPDQRVFGAADLRIPQARFEALRARFREGMPATIFSQIGQAAR